MLKKRRQDHVAILTIDRPERRNALGTALVAELGAELRRLDDDPDIGAIVLDAVPPGFCAGSDLKELGTMDIAAMRQHEAATAAMARSIGLLDTPVIVAVEGFALGGGFILAISGVWSMADFFGQYANAPEVYDVFFGPSMERARQIAAVAPDAASFMSPTLGAQSVIRFNNVQHEPAVFDSRSGLVLPLSGDAQYLFDPADAKDADAFGKRWPGMTRTEIVNSRGELSLIVYRLPADKRPAIATPSAADHPAFAENMRLINSEIAPASVAPGKTATVTLAWEARAPTETDLNLFVHVVDAAGRAGGMAVSGDCAHALDRNPGAPAGTGNAPCRAGHRLSPDRSARSLKATHGTLACRPVDDTKAPGR